MSWGQQQQKGQGHPSFPLDLKRMRGGSSYQSWERESKAGKGPPDKSCNFSFYRITVRTVEGAGAGMNLWDREVEKSGGPKENI